MNLRNNHLYNQFAILKDKSVSQSLLLRLKSVGVEASSFKTFISTLRRLRYPIKSNTCHIIGSGWSASETTKYIKQSDYIIGFNFSAILPLDYNLYLLENATPYSYDISLKQRDLIRTLSQPPICLFKGLHSHAISSSFVATEYSGIKTYAVPDYLIRAIDETQLVADLSSSIATCQHFMPQAISTVFACIQIASFLEFENIVLHGVDFYGPYFFHDYSYRDNPLVPWENNYSRHAKSISHSPHAPHPTSASRYSLPFIIGVLRELLLPNHQFLLSSNRLSPSSNLLPSFF